MTKQIFNSDLFSKHIKAKRLINKSHDIYISLRDAEKLSGISFTTLSRIENGNTPDLETFSTACKWMDKPMELYFKSKTK